MSERDRLFPLSRDPARRGGERASSPPRSAEGHEFWVDRKCANTSGTIKAMLSGPRAASEAVARPPRASLGDRSPARRAGQFTESSGEIKFPEISTPILEKVIQYFYYKLRYTNSQVRIPEFQIDPEMALELLMASNFLDC